MPRTNLMDVISGNYCDNKPINILTGTYCDGTPMDLLHGTYDPVADFFSKKFEAAKEYSKSPDLNNFVNMSVVVLFAATGITAFGSGCRELMYGNNRVKGVAQLTVGVFSSATAFFFANRFNFV